ncbi:hypothetical protein [Phormidium tenue]|uniref:Uncharacterized protein n=1 Tax=Phormidium tenue NIES-30 TaxID=549789 RepID=A0A1U7IZZ2_9CYAN|nr:hypothetical protein [Phormidium tenue]MBD2234069.1 hypothetical protein [Phormidium tenue FACHB-1052]OKH44690.1 hypothetical protein NIES30_22020 [Phormidium tenue NIES-30]
MKLPSVDIDSLLYVDPSCIQKYLESNGWAEVSELRRLNQLIYKNKTKNNQDAFLALPLDKTSPDYTYRVNDLINVIAVVEKRAEVEVFESIRSSVQLAISEEREFINFSLKFENPFQREILSKKLGNLLTSFQSLVDALGQYANGNPSSLGPISTNVLAKVQMSVITTYEGSFGLRFASSATSEQIEILEKPLVQRTLQELLDLLSIMDDDQKLKEKLVQLRKRSASNFRKFLVSLSDLDVDSSLSWGSPDTELGGNVYFSRVVVTKALLAVTRTIQETPDEIEILAEWIGGNKRTKRFEVHDIEGEETYSGSVASDALKYIELATISQIYKVRLLIEPSLNEITQELTNKYTLIFLGKLNSNEEVTNLTR